MEAKAACDAETGGPPEATQPDDTFVRDDCEQLIEAKKCLEKKGFTISEPPSFETFLKSWETGPSSPNADMRDPEDSEQAESACPQPRWSVRRCRRVAWRRGAANPDDDAHPSSTLSGMIAMRRRSGLRRAATKSPS
jgi:hypothetical protein